jgi:outer membrane protein assembly factor BamD (BamD/ComL family)
LTVTGPGSPAAAASTEPHEEEQKLLRAAQAALAAGDIDAAFSLLYEQATKFPKGALAGAREITHATALCRAGKRADARAEAAAFVAAHPDSPLSKDARAICAP